MSPSCSECGMLNDDYSSSHCRCGQFIGWPNFRKAQDERDDLTERYAKAAADLKARKLSKALIELERIASGSTPVIAMTIEACDDLMRDRKYKNYHKSLEHTDRLPALEVNHGDRSMVNERIYPIYGRSLHYAILSPNGLGLRNYGEIAVSWRVTPEYLGRRATLLEENEFSFFSRHHLGELGALPPPGYRATWDDRALLIVAKLAVQITSSTPLTDLPDMVMSEGATRKEDNFVEVVIYAADGIDGRDVEKVTLMRPVTGASRQRRWRIVKEACANRSIAVL